MKAAVFDLDHTLLPIDSGDAWSRWVVRHAGLDQAAFDKKIQAYADAYHEGRFDPNEFVAFQCSLLKSAPKAAMVKWRDQFIEAVVKPALRPEAFALLESRRAEGFEIVLATGTHSFVTAEVAKLFGIRYLAAATPEENPEGEFTGRVVGSHSYGEGKLVLVKALLEKLEAERGELLQAVEAWSDSINDLPILDWAANFGNAPGRNSRAVAVNPDSALLDVAISRHWSVLDLFHKERADV